MPKVTFSSLCSGAMRRLRSGVRSLWGNPARGYRSPRLSRYYAGAFLKGEDFEIGEYTYCTATPLIYRHPGTKLKIGKFCSISAGVVIHLGGHHRTDMVTTYPLFRAFAEEWPIPRQSAVEDFYAFSKGDVVIGNDVLIGHGAMILSGVRVGDGAVIASGAIVTKDVDPYCIVAGNPARLIRKRFDEDTIESLLRLKWWDWPVEKIKKNADLIYSSNVSEMLRQT